jgi:hypothetical protein
MRESRTYGSVRGALSNERPYRDWLRGELWCKRRHVDGRVKPGHDDPESARYDLRK